jgi:hypothetical protein
MTIRSWMKSRVDRDAPKELAAAFAERPGQRRPAEEVAGRIMAQCPVGVTILGQQLAKQFILRRVARRLRFGA